MGVKPTLLTLDKLRDADWPAKRSRKWHMPAGLSREQILNTVSWMARESASTGSLPWTSSTSRPRPRFANTCASPAWNHHLGLLSRQTGHAHERPGIRLPGSEFCRVLNYDELRDYMDHVPRPGCSSRAPRPPRSAFARFRSRAVVARLDELATQSHFLLEQFVPATSTTWIRS